MSHLVFSMLFAALRRSFPGRVHIAAATGPGVFAELAAPPPRPPPKKKNLKASCPTSPLQDPNLEDAFGRTPLAEASLSGHLENVGLLLEAGASTDLANNRGETALMRASRGGNASARVARALLVAGAGTDLANVEGNTALMLASQCGHSQTARLLLEAGRAASRSARACLLE